MPELKKINHTVLVTGWDDDKDAWIILNSFGDAWGNACVEPAKVEEHFPEKDFPFAKENASKLLEQGGCMYIKRGVSCIGHLASWVETRIPNEEWFEKARAEKAAGDIKVKDGAARPAPSV